jgi:hypothetical protein
MKDGAMKWSEWFPLTLDELDQHEPVKSGVYRIALHDAYLKYPKGDSPVIFIGAAPNRTLTECLRDHLCGKGNQRVHQRCQNGDPLRWQSLITDDIENNDDKALQEFLATFGRLPVCNAGTSGLTTQ